MEQLSTRTNDDLRATPRVGSDPRSLCDFTARSRLLHICGEVDGARVLDLGCAEGRLSRELRRRGASVTAVDPSKEKIERARRAERAEPLGIDYRIGDAERLDLDGSGFDLVVAVSVLDALDVEQTRRVMGQVYDRLAPHGRFVFAVPHPAFPFMSRARRPHHFDVKGESYLDARNRRFDGQTWRRDAGSVRTLFVHKTFADYFGALRYAGFERMPVVEELEVSDEHLAADLSFLAPLAGVPLHMAFDVERTR